MSQWRFHPGPDNFGQERGLRAGFRRLFSQGDNPMDWALPLYRLGGIQVRMHLFFIVFVVFKLLFSFGQQGAMGVGYTATAVGSLFLLVLLHEYGHCLACRWVGGEADDILLWPLGGLASCRPPHHWRASLITTIGGPAVNAVLVPVLATALVVAGAPREALVFNPLKPGLVLGELTSYALVALWWMYYANWVLLLFNVCCPMFPLDGGRIVQELLWRRVGYGRSMWISTTVGLGIAGVLAVLGMVSQETNLIMIAIFGGLTCYSERQKLKFAGNLEEANAPWSESLKPDSVEKATAAGPSKAELKRIEDARREQEEVDRILSKIRERGMGSLTAREKRTLEQETERKRRA